MSGAELREILDRNEIGLRRLAYLLSGHPSTVHRWLVGDCPTPPAVAVLAQILDRTDLTIETLEQLMAG